MPASWTFEADHFTACNCDWGCPCNFNAKPNAGFCEGWGVYHIVTGRFGGTALDGARFATYYRFPGPVEDGDGTACLYIDAAATGPQREALELIGTGRAGGGIFELFGAQLVMTWLPTKVAPIAVDVTDGKGRVRIEGFADAESELLSYPDGSEIRPVLELPHGIEYKRALMTNTRRWRWSDGELNASYENRYGAVARVRFTEEGCVG